MFTKRVDVCIEERRGTIRFVLSFTKRVLNEEDELLGSFFCLQNVY